ncbi:MAG: DUF4136 domain-containing protein [Planctomycetota bacterium]|jgi:hypothetical protein
MRKQWTEFAICVLGVCVICFAGCNGQVTEDPLANISDLDIKTAFSPDTSFPDQAVYKFMRLDPAREGYNASAVQLYRRIRTGLQAELASKGYRLFDGGGSVDYVINYQVIGRTSRDLVAQRIEDDGRQWLQMAGVSEEFAEGSLIIDVIDVKTLKPVWRGVSNMKIQLDDVSDVTRQARTNYILHELLKEFPPK